jgi:alkylation response protein AidB-like acyl-CoA dehydrogenase
VRTDANAPKHRGITWLAMPMSLPGIDIRPLPTLLGSGEFSEVFLENVSVPVECRIGAENDGWRVTNVTLSFERGTAFASDMVFLQQSVRDLAALAKEGRALVIATHDVRLTEMVGARVLDLLEGKLKDEGLRSAVGSASGSGETE